MIRASRVTIATLAVAGALTGGAWTLAGAAIPPESEPTAASIVSPTEPPQPDPDQELRDVTARLNSARQQLAASEVQLQQRQREAAAATTGNPLTATPPPADSTPPDDPTPENPAPEPLPTVIEQTSAPGDSSLIAVPATPVASASPAAAEARTRSEAAGSTENPPTQIRDTQHNAEHESGGRDD